MRVYDHLDSGNGYKVRLLLTQLGIPFERTEVDIMHGQSRTKEFLQKNLNGRIPVLETDEGEYLPESNAILFYLSEGTSFLPEGRFERAQVLQWMFFEQYSHEPNIATVRHWLKHIGLDDQRRAMLEQKRVLGYAALEVMERHLADRAFFVSGRYTIADIALYAYTHVADEGGFDLSRFTAINTWLSRVKSQPKHTPITKA
jgi:glutathione S-transferase